MAGIPQQHVPRIATKPKQPLWQHQNDSLKILKKSAVVFDTSDPGTGKTRVALEAWAERRDDGGGCLLVLAPKSILESAWGDDIKKYFPHYTYSVAYSTNRAKAFALPADIYITNLDAVKWLVKQKPSFFTKFDTLVIDEMTAFKHRTSQRSKAAAKISHFFNYREGLTGTPNSNSITDVWHQVFILDGGKRLGRNFFQFRSSTQTPRQVGPSPNMVQWTDKPGAVEAVAGLISDITIRHSFEECMDIPENFTHTVYHNPPAKLFKAYHELKRECILELQNSDVTAVNAAVLRNKLLQLLSGAVYSEEGKYEVVDTSRYELIADLVEQRKHSVCFFNWVHQKDQLKKEFEKRGIEYELIDGSVPIKRREAIVAQYQAGFFQTLLLHPQTGAHGLTLTKGTSTIWSSPIYQPDFLKQGMHRVYRGGQTHKTETIMVSVGDTVEDLVYNRLNEKNTQMINLLELLES